MNDAKLTRAIEGWFGREARDLPWRTTPREPWASFVSEAMLQQTQVARVLEKFEPFMLLFPTPAALADADEDAVLAAWQGLGYYRRARNLQAAARVIVDECGGRVPGDVKTLLGLKGVGRYTAGSIASIVFGQREAIVDGNVVRVLVRIGGKELRAGERETEKWAWARATELVEACESPVLFNEGMMELGARVCTPRSPRCGECPLKSGCAAFGAGSPEAFPLAKIAAKKSDVHHAVVIVRDAAGRVLLERRPAAGLWAKMWQPVGVESSITPPTWRDLAVALSAENPVHLADLTHETSHRTVRLTVWTALAAESASGGKWVAPGELAAHAMANPHRRVLRAALAWGSNTDGSPKKGSR